MQSLVIRRGLSKQAAGEDGPSFEQQFGILTNAVVADKFPQLDSMKIAFQLIEKTDDNAEACGAAVYMVGKNIIFVPSFFKNNKLRTADMLFIAQTQQFLPQADPWLAWIKNKDLNEAGDVVPAEQVEAGNGTKGTTIRDIADPIIKTASVYLRGLLHTEPNLQKNISTESVLDTALSFGKTASESMLDNLIKNTDFLNATLAFYSGDELDAFAKKASALAEQQTTVELIMPFDKEAKSLNQHELNALYKDGFFIRKTAANETKAPDVIRSKQLDGMFAAVTEAGKVDMLKLNGDVENVLVMKKVPLSIDGDHWDEPCCCDCRYDSRHKADPGMTAVNYMSSDMGCTLMAVKNGTVAPLQTGALGMTANKDPFNKEMIKDIGAALDPKKIKVLADGAVLLFPNGTISKWPWAEGGSLNATDDGLGWSNANYTVTVSKDGDNELVKPLVSGTTTVLPKSTRIIMPEDRNADGTHKSYKEMEDQWQKNKDKKKAAITSVTLSTLDAFLTAFCQKRYNKARIYHNGSEYIVSGDKNSDATPKSIKEAALTLVRDYDVDPAIAKVMLKEASNGATYDNPKSQLYYITKEAASGDETEWQDANIPMGQVVNKPPQVSQQPLPTILEDPAQLQQAITTAAQAGIKEVFDISAMKLLIRQNHFFDEIHDDIPLFMKALDSLCRKLFQLYWHTEKMEEKYGIVKLKSLEESLKCTLDSLSELTIFFKLRTVDGSGVTGDTTGELMGGAML